MATSLPALQQLGMEPVMQLVCRDRNRLALEAEIAGAALHGIEPADNIKMRFLSAKIGGVKFADVFVLAQQLQRVDEQVIVIHHIVGLLAVAVELVLDRDVKSAKLSCGCELARIVIFTQKPLDARAPCAFAIDASATLSM